MSAEGIVVPAKESTRRGIAFVPCRRTCPESSGCLLVSSTQTFNDESVRPAQYWGSRTSCRVRSPGELPCSSRQTPVYSSGPRSAPDWIDRTQRLIFARWGPEPKNKRLAYLVSIGGPRCYRVLKMQANAPSATDVSVPKEISSIATGQL